MLLSSYIIYSESEKTWQSRSTDQSKHVTAFLLLVLNSSIYTTDCWLLQFLELFFFPNMSLLSCSLPATGLLYNQCWLVYLPTQPEQQPPLSAQQPHAVFLFLLFFLFYLQGLSCWFYLVWVGPDLLDVFNNVFILLLKVDVMMLLFFLLCVHTRTVSHCINNVF